MTDRLPRVPERTTPTRVLARYDNEQRDAIAALADRVAALEAAAPAPAPPPEPAPEPAPAPAPVPSGAPYTTLHPQAWRGSDFTGPAPAGLFTYIRRPEHVRADTAILFAGRPTLRVVHPPCGTECATEPQWSFGRGFSDVWLHRIRRLMPGFSNYGTPGDPRNAGKSSGWKFGGWGWSGFDGRCSHELVGDEWQLHMGLKNPPESGRPAFVAGSFNPNGSWAGSADTGEQIGAARTDGRWYHDIYHFVRESDRRARFAWWEAPVDDWAAIRRRRWVALEIDPAVVGAPYPLMNGWSQSMNMNRAHDVEQFYSLALVEVIDGSAHPDPFGLRVHDEPHPPR